MPSIARDHGSFTEVIGFLILSPFAVAIAAGWLASRFPERAGVLTVWPALLAVMLVDALLDAVPGSVA